MPDPDLSVDIRLAFPGFELRLDHSFALSGITALFGQSGGGKSTLLRVIAGLESGAAGDVAFGGERWQGPGRFVKPHLRRVGYVFQNTRLFAHLSVDGNLRYAEKRAAADTGPERGDVVRALDLAPLLGRRTGALSGGEKQRVAIGRTLLSRPRLLLMDEPLAALDTRRKSELLPYIRRLPQTFGIPIIYVTHSIEEVAQLADRIVALADGRLLAAGGVAETLEALEFAPATGKFEAGALLDAVVSGEDERFQLTRLNLGGQTLTMPHAPLVPGAHVRLRVRARDVALATRRPEGTSFRNILAGAVIELSEEADTAFAEVLIDLGDDQHLRARVTRAAVHELALTPGAPVFALIKSVSFDRRILPQGGAAG